MSRPSSSKTRSSRCGPISVDAVPDLLLGGLGEPPGERVPRRLPGECRRVRRVARPRAAPRRPRRGRSRRGPGPAARPRSARSRSRSATIARAGVEERLVPEPELVPAGLLLADRPQQAVPLLERPAVGREVAGRRPASAGSRAGRAPRGGAPASPATRSISSGAKTTVRSSPTRPAARRATPLTRIRFRRAAAAAPPTPRPDERDLDRSRGPATALDPGEVACPSGRARASVDGPVGAAPGEQHDRLEQARLAGRVRPHDQLRPGPEARPRAPRTTARSSDRQAPERGLALVRDRRPGRSRVSVRRSSGRGMTTWTYRSSPTGLNTPGESGPLSSRANWSASTFVRTSARYRALNAIVVPSPSTAASTWPTWSPTSAFALTVIPGSPSSPTSSFTMFADSLAIRAAGRTARRSSSRSSTARVAWLAGRTDW